MNYIQWNMRVFERVFNQERARKTTSVYIDENIIHAWALEMGMKSVTAEESCEIYVKDCLKELRGDAGSIARYCAGASRAWQRRGMEGAPDYMGMLALLVLASSWGEGSGHLFYGRYWKLTGTDQDGMIPEMESLRTCWKQLEIYSEKLNGENGIYKLRTLAPAKVNVGVIVAQGVLRPADEITLKDIFFEEGADANIDYSDQHIRTWLDKHRHKLTARAQRALENTDNADYLVTRVREELEGWDGDPADWAEQAGKLRTFKRNAYLCFNRDNSGHVFGAIRLDFSGRNGDPESVTLGNDSQILSASSNGDTVSTPLEVTPVANLDAERRPAEQLKLTESVHFQKYQSGELRSAQAGNTYKYTLNAADVRVFVEGAAYGLPGHVETFGLKPGYGHIVMYRHISATKDIIDWCASNSDSRVQLNKHVPTHFLQNPLWQVTAIRVNAPPCPSGRPTCLTYEVRPLARLTGGLKLYRSGNSYLVGHPPTVSINSTRETTYSINNEVPRKIVGNSLSLEELALKGTAKIIIKETGPDGKESELNLNLIEGSEWVKDRDGITRTVTEASPSTPDYFGGFLGGRKAAFTIDPDECDLAKACWSLTIEKQAIPCAPLPSIKIRTGYMDGGQTRCGPLSNPSNDKKWRNAIDMGALHPIFKNNITAELWKNFSAKSR